MKVFAIRDEDNKTTKDLAYLIYYEKSKKFYIELPDDADPWKTPLLLSTFVKKGEKTVNSYWSKMWVQQRIIPADRQNIGQILKENGLKEYDEYSLLMLAGGRCAQDSYFLAQISPETVEERFENRYGEKIEDVVALKDSCLLVFFRNGAVKKCHIGKSKFDDRLFMPLLSNEALFKKVSIQPGGYGVRWGENIIISDHDLYCDGVDVPLSLEDFKSFVSERIVSTAEAADMLGCSRQNISDLVTRGKLAPVKTDQKNMYFLKSDILHRLWV